MNPVIFALVVVATFVATNLIAFLVRGKITSRIYGADPNAHGWVRISLSLIGTIVGGGMFLAVGQMGYEAGIVGYLVGVAYVVGFGIVAVLIPRIRKEMDEGQHDSLIDLIETRYSRGFAVHFAFVNFAMYLFLLSAQMLALYAFAAFAAKATGSFIPIALIGLGLLSMLLYTVSGGLRKDIWADIVQVLIISVAAILISIELYSKSVMQEIWTKLPAAHLSGTGYGLVFLIGLALLLPSSFLVRIDLWQRIRAARTAKDASIAFVIAGFGSLLFYVLFTTIGMWAYVEGGHKPQIATLEIFFTHFSSSIELGILIGALFAAVLSTADVFINICSLFFAKIVWSDLWQKAKTDPRADRALLFRERVGALVVAGMGILIAWYAANLVDLIVGAFSILLIYLAPIIGTLVPSWRHTKASFGSSTIGLLVFLALFFGWNPKLAFAPAVILSLLTHFIWIRATRVQKATH